MINVEILEMTPDEFRRIICNKLKGKVFHITDTYGYNSIIKSGMILHSNHSSIIKTIWGSKDKMSYFRKRNYISVCDFYHNTNTKLLLKATNKYRIYSPNAVVNDNVAYYIILKERIYDQCISWEQWKIEKAFSEQIVPNLESGIKDKISITDIEYVIKLVTNEETKSEIENRYTKYLKKASK